MIRIATSLSKNYDVTLIGRVKKNSIPLTKRPYQQLRLSLFFNYGILFYLELNFRILTLLLFKPFDMIYSVDLDTITSCSIIKLIRFKRSIFDSHEIFEETPELQNRFIKKTIWKCVGKICIPLQSVCITVGDEVKKYLEKKYNNSFHVVRNVPFEYKGGRSNTSEKVILYQGALNKGRGLEQLIEAMEYVIQNYQLWIVGEGDISQALKDQASASSVNEKIKFLGYKKPEELIKITKKAYLGINLIESSSLNYYYSLANKFFDYIQAGLPSINMSYPEYKALNEVHKVGLLIDKLDAKEVAKTINKLIEDKNEYLTLKENCHIAAKQLCWENEEIRLFEIMEKLVRH